MSTHTRREILKTAVGVGLGAVAADALAARPAQTTESTQFFPGFKQGRAKTSGAEVNYVIGGSGHPLLLLHGAPQNHVMWRKIAPELARNYTVVAADLRGYGDSSKPEGGGDHSAYSKRTMAQDQVDLMRNLGFSKFVVIGHDRGGRVAHRMALDHPDAVEKIAVLDIIPTYRLYHSLTQELATAYYHWFFLIQPAPFPETLINNSVEFYINRSLGAMVPTILDEAAFNEYARCLRDPAMIHGMCEDYRAGASIDLEHDAADLTKKVESPVLALWGEKGPMNRLFDVAATWRERASNVTGKTIPAGHFLAEERPKETLEEITKFLAS